MPAILKQAVETIFTAFVVPALLAPLIWVARALGRRFDGNKPHTRRSLLGLEKSYLVVAGIPIVTWLFMVFGLRIENGRQPATVAAWAVYGILNLLFAYLVVRLTAEYASLSEGGEKDRVFLGFLGIVLLQPLATAGSFAVLYRLLRVVYHRKFPWLDVVQEGI